MPTKPSDTNQGPLPWIVQVNLKKNATMPRLGTKHAAGFDLYSSEYIEIPPGKIKAVTIGVVFDCPAGHYIRVTGKTSLALDFGLFVPVDVVDCDFRGAPSVILYNSSEEVVCIDPGTAVGQAVFTPYVTPRLIAVQAGEISATKRDQSKFGSTSLPLVPYLKKQEQTVNH